MAANGQLNDARLAYLGELRVRARGKRKLAFEAFKNRKQTAPAAERQKTTAPQPRSKLQSDVLAAIRDTLQSFSELNGSQLEQILALLRQHEFKRSGPVEFVVTERDWEGNVKSFEVKS